MDPINIIAGLNLIATFGANFGGAKQGFKSQITEVKQKPKSYLQTVPVYFSIVTLLLFILGLFQIGTLNYIKEYQSFRIAGLIVYIIFSWTQVLSYKTLGDYYSQDIMIKKNHQLVRKGLYRVIRHPQYLSQIFMDLSAGVLTLSFLLIPVALIQIPLLVLRASFEEKVLSSHFKSEFENYKSKTGFFIPFL
ncbi:MAG TPA: isoprenylcysteine carboxylmethyltransferase family protein [Ignavibacteriaceae bacterium]|nr:isoprenylcysteine carboxylmethyltransferase family protein [Ignavibacteriaceae bacterium]